MPSTEPDSQSCDSQPMAAEGDLLIEVASLGKCYRIYDDPTHRLKQAIRRERQYYREFWALRHVSFQLRRGETLGVIGKNGSGKSTLLQLLCGTLTPSEGTIRCHGRIAALLELGSGFNPEFTGIENVFLNASLHGLSRRETEAKLDDILAFADIGDFIGQPVKSYSSGMAVRLAFAVIAHVEAEILVVDEALSVGDAYFNQKCFRFLNRQREENCLLFVSHDTTAVRSLCDKAILLSAGRVSGEGDANQVCNQYLAELYDAPAIETEQDSGGAASDPDAIRLAHQRSAQDPANWRDYRRDLWIEQGHAPLLEITPFDPQLLHSESFGTGEAEVTAVRLLEASSGLPLRTAMGGELAVLEVEARALADIVMPIVGFILKDERGLAICGDNTYITQRKRGLMIEHGKPYMARFSFTVPILSEGDYSICVALAAGTQADHRQLQWIHDAIFLRSECRFVYGGIAGLPMRNVEFVYPMP